jgi:hypothetical protein
MNKSEICQLAQKRAGQTPILASHLPSAELSQGTGHLPMIEVQDFDTHTQVAFFGQ